MALLPGPAAFSDMAAAHFYVIWNDDDEHARITEKMATDEFQNFQRLVESCPDWFAYAVMVLRPSIGGLRHVINLARPYKFLNHRV